MASSGETSNNRMELTAPIMALEALTRPVVVHLYTDSTYVRNGITKWVLGWERNGWKTAAKQPVKNVDLWQRLQRPAREHQVEWFWVKGHSGVADNELADELATRGLQEAIDASGDRRGAPPASVSAASSCPRIRGCTVGVVDDGGVVPGVVMAAHDGPIIGSTRRTPE